MDAGRLYREGTIEGASAVALVARLYEQIVKDVRQALNALEQNNVELRTKKINHAILVIGYLESQLNHEAGGQVAEDLRNFYRTLRQNLVQAQFKRSKLLLAQLITDLLAVREAWLEVERAERAAMADAARLVPATADTSSASRAAHVDWKG